MEEKTEITLTAGYHRVNSREVDLFLDPDSDPGSSKPQSTSVKSQTVTKFNWPKAYYIGSLITASNTFIAYVIRGKSDAVRILNRLTAARVLIKGFAGPVCDVAFAHSDSSLFAAIDESGSIYIYSISQPDPSSKNIETKLLLKIEKRNTIRNPSHRIVWSPHIHHTKDEKEELIVETNYLAATSVNDIEVFKLFQIINDEITKLDKPVIKNDEDLLKGFPGYVTFEAHSNVITDVSIAPDGAVMCTSSDDGYVRFWNTAGLTEDKTEIPNTLHEWYPHDNAPVNCIKFLDNYQVSDPDIPYWRFLLTAAKQTQEIKIWCTVKWNCLQSLSFHMNPMSPLNNHSIPPQMKLAVDQTGNYIMITDINRRVLYCLECCSEFGESEQGPFSNGDCSIRSINVCLIDTPILSFHMSAVKGITMMSAEEPPRRRRGVQIQSFTLHQSNLYKLQSRILHHKSFLSEVPNSGGGTPSGLLSPQRVLSPGVSGDEQIYSPKSRLSDSEEPKKRSRSKTPSRRNKSKSPARKMSQDSSLGSEKKSPQKEENINDMSSIMEKLKNQPRRQSNSSTSTNGAIESTTGLDADKPVESAIQSEATSTEIPVSFASDEDKKSIGDSKSEPEEASQGSQPAFLDKLFGKKTLPEPEIPIQPLPEPESPKIEPEPKSEKPPSLLESIFSQASKKGKGVVTLESDSTLTNITPINMQEESELHEPELTPRESEIKEDPIAAMNNILQTLKQQTEGKTKSPEVPHELPQMPSKLDAASNKVVLIFGDQILSDLNRIIEPLKYNCEIHMLDGALTKNIKKYVTEMGTRKDAEVVIFHVGTNDVSAKTTESQFNTDLMLLFGAARTAFPNAKLCASSVLQRHDEFASKVVKFNSEALKQCEVCYVEFLDNNKIFMKIQNFAYHNNPSECVALNEQGKYNLWIHFLCFIEDHVKEGNVFEAPKFIEGPRLSPKLPKDGIEVRNLTPVCEDRDEPPEIESDNEAPQIPEEPRVEGDGSKKPIPGRDGNADGSQSPLPPTPTSLIPQRQHQTPVPQVHLVNGNSNHGEINTLVMMMKKQSEDIEALRTEMRRNQRNSQETMTRLNQDMRASHEKIDQLKPTLQKHTEKVIQASSPGMMQAMSKSMEQTIKHVYQSSLEKTSIPQFERATKEMFDQLSTAFNRGQEEYLSRTEKMVEKRVKAEINAIEGTVASAEDPNGRLSANLSANISQTLQNQLLSDLNKQMARNTQEQNQLMTRTFAQLRQQLIMDIQKMLDNHTNRLDNKVEDAIARAQTPAPVHVDENADVRDKIRALVNGEKYNEAFTAALMQSNLSLVVDTIESVDPSKIFSPDAGPNGTCLEQNIILSLISQLAQDLGTKSALKLSYLQDAILTLNFLHPSSQHLPQVLGELQQKIVQFTQLNPRDPATRGFKMLNMSVNGIIKELGATGLRNAGFN